MVEQIALVCAAVAGEAAGQDLAGIYSSQLTLKPGLVHTVKGKATIDAKGLLLVAPGAIVEFEKSSDGSPAVLTVMGRMFALGKKKAPIVFRGEGVLRVGKELTIRESLRIKKQSPVCTLSHVALDGVRLAVLAGLAQLEKCAFANAGVAVKAGKLVLRQCTVRDAPAAGLTVERYDTHPAVQVVACTFERCDVGMRVVVRTLRTARSYIGVAGCNFVGNETAAIAYDDSVDLAVGRVHFDGELDCPRGRLIVRERARLPMKQARAPEEVEALLPEN